MPRGILPRHLGPISDNRVNSGESTHGISATVRFVAVAGDSTYNWVNDTPFTFLVTRAYGYMTGAGAASDTAVLQRVRTGTTTAITNTADVSVMSDTDQWDFGQINDAANSVASGDTLRLTTASGALTNVFAEGFWVE